jgi:hypothetical protein
VGNRGEWGSGERGKMRKRGKIGKMRERGEN